MLNYMSDVLFVTTTDGEILVATLAACELFNRTDDELVGRSLNHFLMPNPWLSLEQQQILAAGKSLQNLQAELRGSPQQTIPVVLSVVPRLSDRGVLIGLICITHDGRQARQSTQESLQSSLNWMSNSTQNKQMESILNRYQLLSQHTRDIVLFLRPDGQIIEANRAAIEAYNYSLEEWLSLNFCGLHDTALTVLINDQIEQAYQHGLLYEAVHRRKDSSCFPVEVSIQGAVLENEALLLAIIRDISNRKRSEEKLFRSAFHDALTSLPNRSLFLEQLRRSLQQSKQNPDYNFAVLFLDLDSFKLINDSLGHLVGDQMLVAIAQRLATCLRPEDTLARFGGDEFTILLEDVRDLANATQLAEQIQQQLTQPFKLKGQDIYTTTSIGIVVSTIGASQPEDLLRSADTALYRAKALGGNRYVVFDSEMHSRALLRLRLESDMRRALAEPGEWGNPPLVNRKHFTEFLVYYQPIVSLRKMQIAGLEALVRWQHSEQGLISPTEFIPIAEETGLIVPIGWIVMRQACLQMRQWHQQFPERSHLSISVNLSVKQFTQANLVNQVHQVLRETGLRPQQLKLEITESALMESPETAASMLRELQALGVQIALDDFGTGYSSLAYLHRFPIDTLKVDSSFVRRVDEVGEQLEIVRTILTLAWNLGVDTIAEGIETTKHLSQLRSLRCDYGQGYLFSKPLKAEDATALLAKPDFWGLPI
jgi:diguanylate cyclase (GGDEF)-like protein/PAS domain S-box-containing protein